MSPWRCGRIEYRGVHCNGFEHFCAQVLQTGTHTAGWSSLWKRRVGGRFPAAENGRKPRFIAIENTQTTILRSFPVIFTQVSFTPITASCTSLYLFHNSPTALVTCDILTSAITLAHQRVGLDIFHTTHFIPHCLTPTSVGGQKDYKIQNNYNTPSKLPSILRGGDMG